MKCSKCKLPGGSNNFHICLDLSEPLHITTRIEELLKKPKYTFSEEHRQNLSRSQKERWARRRAEGWLPSTPAIS